jgi:hypothetical protein
MAGFRLFRCNHDLDGQWNRDFVGTNRRWSLRRRQFGDRMELLGLNVMFRYRQIA